MNPDATPGPDPDPGAGPGADPGPDRRRRAVRAGCFVACLAFAAVVLGHLHDHHWNAYDDGAYLHVADRMLRGEVLDRDIQDVHAGYINFANAAAMWLFGNDAVSPRYPLLAMGLANAALAFWLLIPHGTAAAAAGSVALTCLSCTQFMNPTAHWYALFLTLVVLAVMTWIPPRPARHLVLGGLVGLVFLFRQLTGVFVGAAVLLYLLLELPQEGRGKQTWAGRGFVGLMAAVLAGYFVRKVDVAALLMYGIWPVAALLWGVRHLSAPAAPVGGMLLRFTAGFLAAALPLLAYHVRHGSVGIWLDDAFLGALSLTNLPFFDDFRYWRTMVRGARSVLRPSGVVRALTGLFWVVALLLPIVHGVMVVRHLRREGNGPRPADAGSRPPPLPPLPLMAVFYFPVALHFQKYMYFFFAAPVLVLGLLALAPAVGGAAFRRAVTATVFGLSLVALVFLSGGTLRPGTRLRLVADHGVPRCGIRLEPEVARIYHQIIALVERETAEGDAILALPVHPELYYLTGRRNPTRFFNSALGLRSERDVSRLLESFDRSPPKLVFHNPRNSYNTWASAEIISWVQQRYDPVNALGAFTIYRHRGPTDPAETNGSNPSVRVSQTPPTSPVLGG